MDTKTAEALEGSIEKWEKIVRGEGCSNAQRDCPLCHLFFSKPGCDGCPVSGRTSKMGCGSTPYTEWVSHHNIAHPASLYQIVICHTCKSLAQEEVDFLKSLREPEEKKIEPRAGDVWRTNDCYVFVHGVEREFVSTKPTEKLTYTYRGGVRGGNSLESLLVHSRPATRIFSLQEYLKDKEKTTA